MEVSHKIIYVLDTFLVVGTLIALALTFNYAQPLVIAPLNGTETTSTSVLFSFEKAEILLISLDPEFSSPREIKASEDIVVTLEPGVYYWKVKGAVESPVRKLTINSLVDLKLRDAGEVYEVVNGGNVPLNVDIYEKDIHVGSIILEVNRSTYSSGTAFEGRENE